MISIRVRTRISAEELALKVGKVISEDAYNVLLTGPARVFRPDGKILCVYLPGAMREVLTEDRYRILHSLRNDVITHNRGTASGSERVRVGTTARKYAMGVSSGVLGAFDPSGTYRYCRLTSWTGKHLPEWEALRPVFREVSDRMREHVPDRYAAQMEEIGKTHPDWVIPGTPFTTVTVNNTYPTGVHTDKGDLDKGFSSIFALRRGDYTGGIFTFPEYRVAVDLRDGDLILMDAHEWHGNTAIVCACGQRRTSRCRECGAERISVVSYMRTAMTGCGSEKEETAKAIAYREKHKGVTR